MVLTPEEFYSQKKQDKNSQARVINIMMDRDSWAYLKYMVASDSTSIRRLVTDYLNKTIADHKANKAGKTDF